MSTAVEPKTLMDGLFEQMDRCRELKKMYDEIPQGAFGAAMIQQTINEAETAIKGNDVIKMLVAYENLKQCQ